MLHIGTDEAGYGPLLGPLVIAAAVFEGGADRSVFADPSIDDSKRVYSRRGRDGLARALAPYVGLAAGPANLTNLIERLSVRGDPRPAYAWYGEVVDPVLQPVSPPRGFRRLLVNPVCEAEFNAGCRCHAGKAGLLFHETMRLVRAALEERPDQSVEVVCDKHGGRNHYAALLMAELAPTRILTERESREESCYRLDLAGRTVRFSFLKQADGHDPLAGLASMAAKYVRELFMEGFNAYFAARLEGLRPTAGYTTDGRRFLSDIEGLMRELGIDPASLVRER